MTSTEFCYWLQGFFEINDKNKKITAEQAAIIQDHLRLVFDNQTAKYRTTPQQHQPRWVNPDMQCNPLLSNFNHNASC